MDHTDDETIFKTYIKVAKEKNYKKQLKINAL